jgi:hypothetical protein
MRRPARPARPARIEAIVDDAVPDVRDGLTRVQRVVLYELHRARLELGRESIPTALLYGRVVEHLALSPDELRDALRSLGLDQSPVPP